MTALEIKGEWNFIKGKLTKRAKLADVDLQVVAGENEKWVGGIRKPTGGTGEALPEAPKESCGICR